MKLSDEKRAEFWREFGGIAHNIGMLKAIFQNKGYNISGKDFTDWNMTLAKCFKGLQDMQMKFAVAFTEIKDD